MPGVHVLPRGHLPTSKDDLPEQKIVQRILTLSFNSRHQQQQSRSSGSLARVESEAPPAANTSTAPRDFGIPCYPAASPMRKSSKARLQSWRLGPQEGSLKVMVSHAYGLEAADLNGFSDPYVILQSGGYRKKTTVINKTLEPAWMEAFEMDGLLDDFVASGLYLEVRDWDPVGSDDMLGNLTVHLEELRANPHLECVRKLSTKGFLAFSVSWLPRGGSMTSASLVRQASSELLTPFRSNLGRPRRPLPVMLPNKFDWVNLAYQRDPIASKKALADRARLLGAAPPSRSASNRSLSRSSTVPQLVDPPSLSIFEPEVFESFR